MTGIMTQKYTCVCKSACGTGCNINNQQLTVNSNRCGRSWHIFYNKEEISGSIVQGQIVLQVSYTVEGVKR